MRSASAADTGKRCREVVRSASAADTENLKSKGQELLAWAYLKTVACGRGLEK